MRTRMFFIFLSATLTLVNGCATLETPTRKPLITTSLVVSVESQVDQNTKAKVAFELKTNPTPASNKAGKKDD